MKRPSPVNPWEGRASETPSLRYGPKSEWPETKVGDSGIRVELRAGTSDATVLVENTVGPEQVELPALTTAAEEREGPAAVVHDFDAGKIDVDLPPASGEGRELVLVLLEPHPLLEAVEPRQTLATPFVLGTADGRLVLAEKGAESERGRLRGRVVEVDLRDTRPACLDVGERRLRERGDLDREVLHDPPEALRVVLHLERLQEVAHVPAVEGGVEDVEPDTLLPRQLAELIRLAAADFLRGRHAFSSWLTTSSHDMWGPVAGHRLSVAFEAFFVCAKSYAQSANSFI